MMDRFDSFEEGDMGWVAAYEPIIKTPIVGPECTKVARSVCNQPVRGSIPLRSTPQGGQDDQRRSDRGGLQAV